MENLPDHIINKIADPVERARFATIDDRDPEKIIQANFAIACQDRGWRAVWHRTDKRSTANRGCPDFIVAAKGQTFWIEFKKPGLSLAPDQITFKLQLAKNGVQMFIAFSAEAAVSLIESYEPRSR